MKPLSLAPLFSQLYMSALPYSIHIPKSESVTFANCNIQMLRRKVEVEDGSSEVPPGQTFVYVHYSNKGYNKIKRNRGTQFELGHRTTHIVTSHNNQVNMTLATWCTIHAKCLLPSEQRRCRVYVLRCARFKRSLGMKVLLFKTYLILRLLNGLFGSLLTT